MADIDYSHVVNEIKALSLSDQLRLLEEVAVIIRRKSKVDHPRSILEIKGKGKEIWKDLDANSYLNDERSSWDG